MRRWFADVRPAARVDSGVGPDDEQGTRIRLARDPAAPWAQRWPQLRRPG